MLELDFTTKPVGEGNGLGMSTVYGIVQQNGGDIEIESSLGEGTTVRIWFPRTAEDLRPGRTDHVVSTTENAQGLVAVVEDEPALLRLTCRGLEELGYQVVPFDGPEAALEHLHPEGVSPDVVVTDVVMPKMSGPDLITMLRERFSSLPAVFVSGYTPGSTGLGLEAEEMPIFLAKPFRIEQLGQAIQEALTEE